MTKAVDSKKLAGSKLPWAWNSPIGERLEMGDLCHYAPGMLNKLGKEGRTSWDSLSYFLMMGHNVYQHIESVQRANALNDTACAIHQPDPSTWSKGKKGSGELSEWVPKNVIYTTELINRVFTSQTPFTELDKAKDLLASVNGVHTLKSSANSLNNSALFGVEEPVVDEAGDIFASPETAEECELLLEGML